MMAYCPWVLPPCDPSHPFPIFSGSPEQQKKLWLDQLLRLIQKKNSLVTEEAELMITVQELDLEEKQRQLDHELRGYMNREGLWATS